MTEPLADPWPAPHPDGPVRATVSVPGSKSLTNRALVLAALSDGPSTVRGALRSRDTELMAQALSTLGCPVDTTGDDWTVTPGEIRGRGTVDCGLAGTVMRFVPPVAALADGPVVFDGDPHARTRPMDEVIRGLRGLGVEIQDEGRGALPFTVEGHGSVRGGRVTIDASASSQFISALLLAGARYDEGVDVRHDGKPVPSLPHIDMTVQQLRLHGVEVDDSDANRWQVLPGKVAAVDTRVEPDLSNAGAFVAAALVTGGSVTVRDWPRETTQAGDALRGIAHIRGHETDRLAALATEFVNLGGHVTETPDGLTIRPAHLHGGTFRTYADHRMAHAGVVLGLRVAGVAVEDVATTAKTFPGFAEAWTRFVEGS